MIVSPKLWMPASLQRTMRSETSAPHFSRLTQFYTSSSNSREGLLLPSLCIWSQAVQTNQARTLEGGCNYSSKLRDRGWGHITAWPSVFMRPYTWGRKKKVYLRSCPRPRIEILLGIPKTLKNLEGPQVRLRQKGS